jgi:capsid protein
MGLLGRIFGGGSRLAQATATIAAQKAAIHEMLQQKFDAAETTELNRRHWSMADYLSADAALTPEVRRKLRARARLEAQNNPYVAGIASTLATGLVGTGPRLRLDIPDANPKDLREVERRFFDWCTDIELGEKIRLMRAAQVTDGDPFAVFFNNPRLPNVQLDLRTIESDQVASPWEPLDKSHVDGLRFDENGSVVAYHILDEHPGSFTWASALMKGNWRDAEDVIHWPYITRPGQHRGFGQIVPALELFALLRRFVLATVTAAEFAASFAAILKTQHIPDAKPATLKDFETFPIFRGMMTALPDGWDWNQLKAEHPNTTFVEFERRIIGMAARACNMPVIVATMDATGANYSTMRGDYLVLRKHFDVDRSNAERVILDRCLRRWFEEAIFIRGHIPRGLPPFIQWNWNWAWDQFGHIDPVKEAAAEQIRLECRTTTLARLYAAQGLNWREEIDQAAIEHDYLAAKGLTVADVAPMTRNAIKQAIAMAISEDDETKGAVAKAA